MVSGADHVVIGLSIKVWIGNGLSETILPGQSIATKIKKWRRDKADNDAAASGSYQAIRKTAEALAKANENKGFIIPRGTALLIEQCAILKDATNQYMLNLYMKAGFRSRL